jgi:hypothetical protein
MLTLHVSTRDHGVWGGPKRWIRVFIHDSPEELVAAAQRYSPHMGFKEGTLGCFHPVPTKRKYIDGEWVNTSHPSFAGVMRLWAGDVDAHIVTHEVVHAAAAIYRMDVRPIVHLGRECNVPEEDFAYIVGDLNAGLAIALHDARAWSTYKE